MIRVPITSDSVLRKYLAENKAVVYSHIVDLIESALEVNEDAAEFCQFGNSHFYGVVPSEEFPTVLSDAMQFFIENEEFEEAARCKSLLIDVVIDDVTKWPADEESS